jgi:hypothetical protein
VTKAGEVRLGRLIPVDGLLDIEQVDLRWDLKPWRRKTSVHAEVRVLLELLQCLWWESIGRLEPLLDLLVPVPIQALPSQELVRLVLVVVNLRILLYCSHIACSEGSLHAV